mgnify:CR=1 FL=1
MSLPLLTSPDNVNFFTEDNPCDRVMTDSEWHQPHLDKSSIYTYRAVVYFDKEWKPRHAVVFIHPDLPLPALELPNVTVIHRDALSGEEMLTVAQIPVAQEITVGFFYSPKDMEALLGRDMWRASLLEEGVISKKRNLTGVVKSGNLKYKLFDMVGMFNSTLDAALKSVGIKNEHKDLVERLGYSKSDMWTFSMNEPDNALLYVLGDTVHGGDLYKFKVDLTNTVISNALGIPTPFDYDNFPRSAGALVAKTYEAYLMEKHPRLFACLLLMCDSVNDKTWYILKNLTKAGLITDENVLREANNKVRGNDQIVHGLGMGSISNYAILAPQSGLTSVYNAVVQGGRCVNEEPHINPRHNRISNAYDPDNSSCYGSALRQFDMPFGIPSLMGFDRDDEPFTLGQFMDKEGSNLVPHLYQIFVNGSLTFNQDLIHSKCDLTTAKIMSTLLSGNYSGDEDNGEGAREINTAHVGGSFELNTKEITLGVITHDVWSVIKEVASSKELNEIRNLKVATVAAYRKEDELTVDEWCDVMSDPIKRGRKTRGKDDRTSAWCRLPLEDFVGKFVEYRKSVKKLEGGNTKGTTNYLLQTNVKLFVNTTYGCMASPYFPMGNTVIANNITARARTGGWMLSKALLLVQLITDGGLGSGNRVATIVGDKLPSFGTFADRPKLLKHRSIKCIPLMTSEGKAVNLYEWLCEGITLGGKEYKNRCNELDATVNKVVTDFWAHWKLTPLFDVECKYEHTGRTAVYFGNADYLIHDIVQGALDGYTGESKDFTCLPMDKERGLLSLIKCRGTRGIVHPKQGWLLHLLDSTYPCPAPDYTYSGMIGVNEWKDNPHDVLMPGDHQAKTTVHMPYRSGFLAETHTDRKKDNDTIRKQTTKFKKDRNEGDRFGYALLVEQGKLTDTITPASINGKRVITNT